MIEEIKNILGSDFNKLDKTALDLFSKWFDLSYKYYHTTETEVTDYDFDKFQNECFAYGNSVLSYLIRNAIVCKDSPYIRIKHNEQEMISLKKIHIEDVEDKMIYKNYFIEQERYAELKNPTLYLSPKLDGNALKVIWKDSKITSILSRGGQELIDKLKNVKGVNENKPSLSTNMVVGELVIDKQVFKDKYSENENYDYKNARNFVGGMMNSDTVPEEVIKDLQFVACTNGVNPYKDYFMPMWSDLNTIKSVEDLYERMEHFRSEDFPFLCDGIVIAYEEPYKRIVKENYPLNMVAIKFPNVTAVTVVNDIEWTVKKTGRMTPVLVLEPVELDGSTISRATGYNYGSLIEKGIGIGAKVEITKSGDIIPIVKNVLAQSKDIKLPEGETYIDGVHLMTGATDEIQKQRFVIGFSKLDFENVGTKNAEIIGEAVNWDIVQIFNPLLQEDIKNALCGGAVWKSFENEIANTRSLFLDQLIYILQYEQVGKRMSKKVALLLTKQSEDKSNVPYMVHEGLLNNESTDYNLLQESIKLLESWNIKVLDPINESNESTITYEMTGSPIVNGEKLKKKDFIELIEKQNSNLVHTSLTQETNYLIAPDTKSTSGKVNKARKYNVKVITYDEAIDLFKK